MQPPWELDALLNPIVLWKSRGTIFIKSGWKYGLYNFLFVKIWRSICLLKWLIIVHTCVHCWKENLSIWHAFLVDLEQYMGSYWREKERRNLGIVLLRQHTRIVSWYWLLFKKRVIEEPVWKIFPIFYIIWYNEKNWCPSMPGPGMDEPQLFSAMPWIPAIRNSGWLTGWNNMVRLECLASTAWRTWHFFRKGRIPFLRSVFRALFRHFSASTFMHSHVSSSVQDEILPQCVEKFRELETTTMLLVLLRASICAELPDVVNNSKKYRDNHSLYKVSTEYWYLKKFAMILNRWSCPTSPNTCLRCSNISTDVHITVRDVYPCTASKSSRIAMFLIYGARQRVKKSCRERIMRQLAAILARNLYSRHRNLAIYMKVHVLYISDHVEPKENTTRSLAMSWALLPNQSPCICLMGSLFLLILE